MKSITVHTTAIEPRAGLSRANGACRMALVDIFVADLSLTLRGLELTYNVDAGWEVIPPMPKKGLRSFAWPAGSPLDRDIAASASKAYLKLGSDEIATLREKYSSLGPA